MNRIDAKPKNVRELLNGVSYTIDYFQREYKWGTEQIEELLDDLESKFLASYSDTHERTDVANYARYYLGSIIVSQKDSQKSIIDGQQRLTSLTLLLIYLQKLQQEQVTNEDSREDVRELIYSAKFGRKSFNIDVEDRRTVMDALFSESNSFDLDGQSESARNIYDRYKDIEELFPDSLKGPTLPYFVSWLKENVDLVEITAFSEEDAYQIFETMNDRGLNLSLSDMLKGYLLARVGDANVRNALNDLWKRQIQKLNQIATGDDAKEEDANFFKAWFRAKYADTIRDRKKDAKNKDFEEINTYHKWVRDNESRLGLQKPLDYHDFLQNQFHFFSDQYARMRLAAQRLTPGMEHLFYNAYNNFTLQYMLALAPLCREDDQAVIDRKINLVTAYIDIFVARRIANSRTLKYSSIVYTMFNLMKEMRNLGLADLASVLNEKVKMMDEEGDTFDGVRTLVLRSMNKRYVHYLLSRITAYVDQECGVSSNFVKFVSRHTKKPFEIAHVMSSDYEYYYGIFKTPEEYEGHYNQLGALVLAGRGFDRNYGADLYGTKINELKKQNVLAATLAEDCYQNNPSFIAFVQRTQLPFKPLGDFDKAELTDRAVLYQCICEEVWRPTLFENESRA